MDLNKLEGAISDPAMQFYLCGPVGFMQFAAKQLVGFGREKREHSLRMLRPA